MADTPSSLHLFSFLSLYFYCDVSKLYVHMNNEFMFLVYQNLAAEFYLSMFILFSLSYFQTLNASVF